MRHPFNVPMTARRLRARLDALSDERKARVVSYIDRDEFGRHATVCCKRCGDPIVDGRGRPLTLYAELTMQFEDGSYHTTCLCRSCAGSVRTLADLEELYVTDLCEMLEDEKFLPGRCPLQEIDARVPKRVAGIWTLDKRPVR